jgi:hypothetical protein
MSINQADSALDFLSETQGTSRLGSLFGTVRTFFSALAEGKAAADHYESLVARGTGAGEASRAVFRKHFGKC